MPAAVAPLSTNLSKENGIPPIGVSAASQSVRRSSEESVDRFFETARFLPPFDSRSMRGALGLARPTAKIFAKADLSTARVVLGRNADYFRWAAPNTNEMLQILVALSGDAIGSFVRPVGAIAKTLADLDVLHTWDDGWNGYDAAAPNPKAIIRARHWIMGLYSQVLLSSHRWMEPNVTADSGGEVVFGWWCGKKELTIYVTGESAEYMRVWGPNVASDMSEGDAGPVLARLALWQWLITT